jgi:hypothetical protein
MENETNTVSHGSCHHKKHCGNNTAPGAVYGMAFIGSAIYYIQQADTFWMGVLGVLKAIIWPATLIYQLLGFLHM